MKKNLFISALAAFAMMLAINVSAQERATGQDFKDLKKHENTLDKNLQKRAIKEARKEAKKLEFFWFDSNGGALLYPNDYEGNSLLLGVLAHS